MQYRETLVSLYATNPASAVKDMPEYAALKAQFGSIPGFLELRAELDSMKTTVEREVTPNNDEALRLKRCIRFLRLMRGDVRRLQLAFELIQAAYATDWTAQRQAYLTKCYVAVLTPKDYFFSFTERYQGHGIINPINQDFKHFIDDILEEEARGPNRRENLLARAINAVFSVKASGFFYPDTLDDNAITDEKLKRELSETMVFVQLVQTVMFAKQDKDTKKNYCFLEWDHAKQRPDAAETQLVYLVADPSSQEELGQFPPYFPYKQWYDHILAKSKPFIVKHRGVRDEQRIEQTRQQLEHLRDHTILGVWQELETAAP